LTIANTVTSIGNNAFYAVNSLTGNLTIPNNVTSIGNTAFLNCGFSGTLTIGSGVTSIGSEAFSDMGGLTTVLCYVTKTIVDAGTDCFTFTGITTIRARASDGTWTAGANQTIGGKSNITVIKNL
jgi:hypothetical protein